MAKKPKTNQTPTPAKKPEVLALKRKPPTPEPEGEILNDASVAQTPQPGVEVTTDAPTTSVKSPDALAESDSTPTPGAEIESVPHAQPLTESVTPTLESEVLTDVPPPTPTAKANRPVLRKKSERDALASSEAPTTPGLLEAPPDGALFQAVGIIVGDVTFNKEGKATVAIGEKVFPLFYAPPHKRAYEALKIEIKKTGVVRQRLLVYPRITHFPKREELHSVGFQLVAFRRSHTEPDPNDALAELNDMEFKLSGLWQFIPVCQTPCVSVFKNYTTERKDFIKEADVAVKVNFMKSSHVPLMWRDAPVRPFRFNPKLDKEHQGHAAFVQLKARFDPNKDVFHFLELASTPASNPPRFLKAGKKDKLQVATEKLKAAKGAKGAKGKPQVVKK
jgi:hypothetical protein